MPCVMEAPCEDWRGLLPQSALPAALPQVNLWDVVPLPLNSITKQTGALTVQRKCKQWKCNYCLKLAKSVGLITRNDKLKHSNNNNTA